jgi:hypothetical protein
MPCVRHSDATPLLRTNVGRRQRTAGFGASRNHAVTRLALWHKRLPSLARLRSGGAARGHSAQRVEWQLGEVERPSFVIGELDECLSVPEGDDGAAFPCGMPGYGARQFDVIVFLHADYACYPRM